MENNDKKTKKINICFIVILIECFLYLAVKATYTAYESEVEGDVRTNIAKIKLLVNGVDVSQNRILIDDIDFEATRTRDGKLAPGVCGTFNLELNPTGSQVAILYKIQYIDKSADSTKLMLFDSVTSSNSTIVRTGQNEYSGIIPLASIDTAKPKINIDFCYPDEGEQDPMVDDDRNLDDFFEMDFYTIQYLGETLVPYTPPSPSPSSSPTP